MDMRRFRRILNGLSSATFLLFLSIRLIALTNPSFHPHRRIITEIPLAESSGKLGNSSLENPSATCAGLGRDVVFAEPCEFLRAHPQCDPGGFFDYLRFFYCSCKGFRLPGYLVLGLWLSTLFYLLGNTAADYFCCNLAKLSSLLKLSPTLAGVSLLPLGNGAPDVFASVAAFLGAGAGEVGVNSVLGGAVFVTSVVAGTVSLCVAGKSVHIDRRCFIRDVGFFLLTLSALSVILFVGRVSLFGAIAFVSIYIVYAFAVTANELLRKHARLLKLDAVTPLLPVRGSIFASGAGEDESVYSPFLEGDESGTEHELPPTLPEWMWASNVAIYSNQSHKHHSRENSMQLWGWKEEGGAVPEGDDSDSSFYKMFTWIDMPLSLPRRLTIPVVEEDRWSKIYAVSCASLAPLLLVILWSSSDANGSKGRVTPFLFGGMFGLALGTLAFFYTVPDRPPRRFLFPWVLGGFVMSIIWFYIIANELVALLVSLGIILGINPSILGLTVLAWGNSMGDLMSNVSLAMKGGGDGVQIAMSGCYAGPMFNTLVGLGVSILFGAWSTMPTSYELPKDSSLVWTMGFLVSGLIWSLYSLIRNDMQPNRLVGFGLIGLYVTFLFVRISCAWGILSLPGLH